jgi:hypothetical protein
MPDTRHARVTLHHTKKVNSNQFICLNARKQIHCSRSDYMAQQKKSSSYWIKIESGTFGQYGEPVKGSNELILYRYPSQNVELKMCLH